MKPQSLVMSMLVSIGFIFLFSYLLAMTIVQTLSKETQAKIGLVVKGEPNYGEMKQLLGMIVSFWLFTVIYSIISFNVYVVLTEVLKLKPMLKAAGLKV